MQVTETEILIPLTVNVPLNLNKNKRSPRRQLLSICVQSALVLIFCISFLVFFPLPDKTANGRPAPGTDIVHTLFILIIVLTILTPLVAALTIALQVHNSRVSRYVRINHEGIFFSTFLPILIKWDEIATFVPYTWKYFGSRRVLGIVPRDTEAIIARVIEKHSRKSWQRVWYRFLARVNIWLLYRSNALTPLHILEFFTLPISIDELITAIQEHFATELREHDITVLGW